MKTSFRLLLNSLLCIALATAGSGAQAGLRPELPAGGDGNALVGLIAS